MEYESLYSVLGVDKTASSEEIRAAFKKKAQKTHPDKETGSKEIYELVNRAFQTLYNAEKRRHYDATGRIDTYASPAERKLKQTFKTVIENYTYNTDVLKETTRLLDNELIRVRLLKAGLVEQQNKLNKLEKKISHKTGKENLFAETLLVKKQSIKEDIIMLTSEMAVVEQALDLLQDYSSLDCNEGLFGYPFSSDGHQAS